MITINYYLHKLFDYLNNNQIKYAVLRNYQQLPDSCAGSDMDIWIYMADYNRFIEIVQKVCVECEGVLASYLPDRTCPRLVYLGRDWGIQFDVHIGVAQHRGVSYMNNSIIENHIIEYNGVKVLTPEIDGFISFLKEVLNNKSCKISYCNQVADLVEHLPQEKVSNYLNAFSIRVRNEIIEILTNRTFDEKTIKKLGKNCSNDLQTFLSRLKYMLGQFCKLVRFVRPLGYTIVVLGTDGSGKSFIINSIAPVLNEAFHNGIHYEHMRPNYFPSLAVLTGKKKKTDNKEVCSNPHGAKPAGFIGSIIRLTYYWLDYTYGYFRKVFFDKSLKSHVWIFDRYYYDYFMDQRRARLHLPNWIFHLYGIFVPKPDLILCLGGTPEQIYARKPETSFEEVKRQTAFLKKFCLKHKNAVWIDTTIEPEDSIHCAMSAILKMMSKRFSNMKLK